MFSCPNLPCWQRNWLEHLYTLTLLCKQQLYQQTFKTGWPRHIQSFKSFTWVINCNQMFYSFTLGLRMGKVNKIYGDVFTVFGREVTGFCNTRMGTPEPNKGVHLYVELTWQASQPEFIEFIHQSSLSSEFVAKLHHHQRFMKVRPSSTKSRSVYLNFQTGASKKRKVREGHWYYVLRVMSHHKTSTKRHRPPMRLVASQRNKWLRDLSASHSRSSPWLSSGPLSVHQAVAIDSFKHGKDLPRCRFPRTINCNGTAQKRP